MAGKKFTLNDFKQTALTNEQTTSLKGGNVSYPHDRVASQSTRISWEGLDIRINVPTEDPEVQMMDLSRKFIALR